MTSQVPLVIGCPVHRRAWILDAWFDAVEAQEPPDGTRFVFLLSEEGDPSERVILRRAPSAEMLYVPSLPALGDEGRYDDRRHSVLASIRNRLLRVVGSLAPAHFLSLDSDILLEPGALAALLAVGRDAVGASLDMGGEDQPGFWSWMELDGDFAYRPPLACRAPEASSRPFSVGVIMGAKLLSPVAYRGGRYADHILGEDIAFALSLRALEISRWLCPAARARHAYRPGASSSDLSPETAPATTS